MKYLFTLIAILALALGVSAPAQAQTSNILVIGQTPNNIVSVLVAQDDGVTGSWLSYSNQVSTTVTAIENKLFNGLAAGTVLIVRIDPNKTMTVMVVNDTFFVPGTDLLPTGTTNVLQIVYQDVSLAGAIGSIKDRLYLGL